MFTPVNEDRLIPHLRIIGKPSLVYRINKRAGDHRRGICRPDP